MSDPRPKYVTDEAELLHDIRDLLTEIRDQLAVITAIPRFLPPQELHIDVTGEADKMRELLRKMGMVE